MEKHPMLIFFLYVCLSGMRLMIHNIGYSWKLKCSDKEVLNMLKHVMSCEMWKFRWVSTCTHTPRYNYILLNTMVLNKNIWRGRNALLCDWTSGGSKNITACHFLLLCFYSQTYLLIWLCSTAWIKIIRIKQTQP